MEGIHLSFPFALTRWLIARVMIVAWLLLAGWASAGDGGPPPASMSLSADGRLQLSPTDRCPVCAMFPARQPQSAAAMTLQSGRTYYFCSNGCLLRSWLRPLIYLNEQPETIGRLVVQDYFSGQPIDGHQATWVAGSDVVGPMGPAIVALGTAGHLAAFKKRHGGNIVFTIDQLDDPLWRRISHRELPSRKKE